MREVDQLRAFVPPLTVVPGVPTVDGSEVVGNNVDSNPDYLYEINQNGWDAYVQLFSPPPGAPADWKTSPWAWIYGVHETRTVWSPFARMEIAAVPLSHDVADGTLPQAFYGSTPETTVSNDLFPKIEGAFTKVLDLWTSEKLPEKQQHNLVWNGILFGTEPGYEIPGVPNTSHLLRPEETPSSGLRFDQVISARYRTFGVPVGESDAHSVLGGYQPLIHESQIGGNATISDNIYHYRAFFCWQSAGTPEDRWSYKTAVPTTQFWRWNYLKQGIVMPSSIDTLTIGMDKVESDAEWSTLARRGMKRNDTN